MSFVDLGLSPEVVQAVTDAGYTQPTPIQAQAIPVVLMGRDVLGCAQTGTGKTASFTLPMIEILAGGQTKARAPRSLILEPTRELAAQVAENFTKYGKYNKLSMALLIGGVSFGDQEDALDRGVDVLIATPGRLIDHFERGKVLMNFVKTLVIDEADRMLDMGFMPDVEKIVGLLSPMRQTLFFSATMPKEIRQLADKFLQNPKEITVAPPATTSVNVAQHIVIVEEDDKREALRRLLREEDVKNAIIFCNRKKDVDIVAKSLVKHGFNARAMHGDLPQSYRTETLEKFKSGEVNLLVASDVAARGIDVADLSHVFNFDIPFASDDYVHRIGRTGRAGRKGVSYTLVTPTDTKLVQAVEQLINKEIPRFQIEGLDVLDLVPAEEITNHRRGGRGGRPGGGTSRSGGRFDKSAGGGRGERRPRRGEAAVPVEAVTEEPVVAAVVIDDQPREERAHREERPAREAQTREAQPREERAPREAQARDGQGRDRDSQPREDRNARDDRRPRSDRPERSSSEERPRRDRNDVSERGGDRDRNRHRDRDNDLGPRVLGFGNDVPAFMLIRAPAPGLPMDDDDLIEQKPVAEAAPAPAKRSRSRKPARSKKEVAVVETAGDAPIIEAVVTEAPAADAAAEPSAKPKRRAPARRKAAPKAAAAEATEAPVEAVAADAGEAPAKPKRRAPTRRKKADAEAPAEATASKSEDAA